MFVRRRGASAERRKQLAWLGYVGLMTVIWAAALVVAGVAAPGASNGSLGTLLWSFLVRTPVAGVPLACAVAVLKYRLYEIDRIISRTLAYAIVTGLLVGVYAGLVLLATRVCRSTPRWRWPPPRWLQRRCSARCDAGAARGGPPVQPGQV